MPLKYYNRNEAYKVFELVADVLGYETVAEHFFNWLSTDDAMHALLDLATDYDIDIEKED